MITLIDNYDSFTYNLVHYLGDLGVGVNVLRNDERSAEDILAANPSAIVLSPGPCTPNEAGVCLDLVQKSAGRVPILGVCLGHQAIGQAYGGRVVRAPVLMHGKVSNIFHEGVSLFSGLPNPFQATRYHSLIVDRQSLPDCLVPTAFTEDGLVMALEHRQAPVFGVQFHPESIASAHGHAILASFLDLAGVKWHARKKGLDLPSSRNAPKRAA